MIKVLCVSNMHPNAPTGVVTYYKKLRSYFDTDHEISIDLVTVADVSRFQKGVAGIVRRIIYAFSFSNKRIEKFSNDINLKIKFFFALYKNRKVNYTAIHAQDIATGCFAKSFFNNKIPLILTCHFNDNPVEEDMVYYHFTITDKKYLTDYYTSKFRNVDKFIFVSRYVYEKSKTLMSKESNFEVIYNGVNFSGSRSILKSGNILHIVNVGFVERRKNQMVFVAVARELIHRNFFDFHITIVGDGHDLVLLRKLIDSQGLNAYFSFPGWASNVEQYLQSSDLYIHTAINDNCPYSLIEAISQGVPALAFDVGGIPEILSGEYLFKLDDYPAIVQFIIENRSRLADVSQRQYNQIAETFSIENQFKRTKQIYVTISQVSSSC